MSFDAAVLGEMVTFGQETSIILLLERTPTPF
jgi:hypothetical protein